MKKIIIKLYDWSQTPLGDSILGGLALLAAMAAIYWFFWLLIP